MRESERSGYVEAVRDALLHRGLGVPSTLVGLATRGERRHGWGRLEVAVPGASPEVATLRFTEGVSLVLPARRGHRRRGAFGDSSAVARAVSEAVTEPLLPTRVREGFVSNAGYRPLADALADLDLDPLARAASVMARGASGVSDLSVTVLEVEEGAVSPRRLDASLTLLRDLAAGAPLEWAVHRHLGSLPR